MTTTEFVNATHLKATGKLPTFAVNSDKWNRIVALGNLYIDDWANEPDVDWNSLYEPAFVIGTITATDTFDLDDDIRSISLQMGDPIRINHLTGSRYTDYDLVSPERFKTYSTGYYVTQFQNSLKFNTPFKTSNPQFGGTLTVPAYLYPEHLVNTDDEVPVDNPNWLVYVAAAAYISHDITRKQDVPPIQAEANELMRKMIENNDAQINEVDTSWSPLSRTFR